MRTIKLTLAYDGTDFVGWQTQQTGRSVQTALEGALEKITGADHQLSPAGEPTPVSTPWDKSLASPRRRSYRWKCCSGRSMPNCREASPF